MLQGPTAGRLLLVPALGGSGVQNRSRNRVGCAARAPGTGSQADTVLGSGYRVLPETLGSHQSLSPLIFQLRTLEGGAWRWDPTPILWWHQPGWLGQRRRAL